METKKQQNINQTHKSLLVGCFTTVGAVKKKKKKDRPRQSRLTVEPSTLTCDKYKINLRLIYCSAHQADNQHRVHSSFVELQLFGIAGVTLQVLNVKYCDIHSSDAAATSCYLGCRGASQTCTNSQEYYFLD